jgi:uncharacterized paraquat-inducible protein A
MITKMTRNTAITIIFGVTLIFVISALAFSTLTSMSVGGAIYSNDPDTCASCHNEVPYVKGYEGTAHDEGNVTCIDCHQYPSPITDAQCITCHEDYRQSNKTQFEWLWVVEIRVVDAHSETAHIPAKCTTCHIEHKFVLGTPRPVTESICSNCHSEYKP